MARELILETTFLVDLEREARRDRPGPATACLENEADSVLNITSTIAGEMATGASLDGRSSWEAFLSAYRILGCTPDVCWLYGDLYRYLRQRGSPIATNDLWIAASVSNARRPVRPVNAAGRTTMRSRIHRGRLTTSRKRDTRRGGR